MRAELNQDVKDVMMGHKRAGARGDYECSEATVRQVYNKAFRFLSINHGVQVRDDLKLMENTVTGLAKTIAQQQEKIDKVEQASKEYLERNEALTLELKKIAEQIKELEKLITKIEPKPET